MTLTLNDIYSAAKTIQGKIIKTLCAPSTTLSEITGASLILKFENLQFTGSFKERGALNKLLSLPLGKRKTGVIAMSAGKSRPGRSLPRRAPWHPCRHYHAPVYSQS